MERRLAAILLTDMVGYSKLLGLDEAGTVERQRAHREHIIEPKIAAYRGRLVNTTGDGLLAEFPSVVDAVRCAVEVQQEIAENEADVPEERRIQYRIGINLGDIIIDGDDILGDGVNIAARLEALADPGGITLSGDAFRQVRGKIAVEFEDLGEQRVKNIADPVRVYQVANAIDRGVMTKPANDSLSLPTKPSIAVLPFTNMSDDRQQDFLSDGISEDLITELSRFRGLFVIARNSSFAYKNQAIDVQHISSQLGVRYILEGSLRRAGNRIRVSAQLVDAPTRKQVWAERYDRELEDIFNLQDEITQTIVAAIEPELGSAERDRARRTATDNLDAWGLYQRGLWHVYRFTANDNTEARALFERATIADPSFARAFAGLSFTHFISAFLGFAGDRERYRNLALETARHSVMLDDRDEAARWALGRAYMIRGDHDRAIAEFDAAININPNFAQAHYNLAFALVLAGRHEESLPCLDKAERLSPRDPLLFAFCAVRAQALFHIGEYDRSLQEARRSSRQSNVHANARALLVAVLGQLGRLDEARSELALLLAERSDYTRREFAAGLPYRRAEDMSRLLESLEAAGMPE